MKPTLFCIALLALALASTSTTYAQEEKLGNFEIQRLTSAFNQAETLSSSLKGLITQQMPAEYATVSAKSAAWNQQTAQLAGIRTKVDSLLDVISRSLKDKEVTKTEWGQTQAKAKDACTSYKANTSAYAGADVVLRRRYESVNSLFQALCTNEQ